MEDDFVGEDRRSGEDRRERPIFDVNIDGFKNGAGVLLTKAVRWLRRTAIGLLLGGVAAGGWLARQEFTNSRQNSEIALGKSRDRVIDQALGDAIGATNMKIESLSDEDRKLWDELARIRESQAGFEERQNTFRRDYERVHGGVQ